MVPTLFELPVQCVGFLLAFVLIDGLIHSLIAVGFGLGYIYICLGTTGGTRDTAHKEPSEVNANCRRCAAHDSFSPLF